MIRYALLPFPVRITARLDARREARLREACLPGNPAFSLTFEVSRVEVAQSADLAYAQGPFRLTATNPATNKSLEDKGTYLVVYKKQADGSWKAAIDMGTSEISPAAPAPPPLK
jgi:hypothetical protein